ncbi:IS630 transposase-related protein [Rubrivirga litoralis]|uniref:IS630 transposase-related protein n=1 Tax=Rubrivirga litoralis TaxID=3075598 RepID=A0ABU3BUS6_9BACT|nr:IS630 transposase-related protein [Rubrivirga sp. F394]MDT0632901.1 IS630 transposase-related protein [Rubrivirga sp. F394]
MAVSVDLRRRAVAAYQQGGASLDAVAARFDVGRASLVRWLALQRDTGALTPRPNTGGTPFAVTETGKARLQAWLDEDPSVPQHELAARLADAGEPAVSQQTVGRTLARMALTHKKSLSELSSDSATT